MKRLLAVFFLIASAASAKERDFTLHPPRVPEPRIEDVEPIPVVLMPQTNTFCAANLTCTVTAAWTFTSLIVTSFAQSLVAPNISYKTPFDYGAKGNVVTLGPSTTDNTSRAGTFTAATCSITAATAILTCTGANYTAGDVTKPIVVNFAGAQSPAPCTASFPCALVTTILSFQSATQVTLSANATTTVTNTGLVYYGTDDGTSIANCVKNGTLAGGRCTLNSGVGFMVSNSLSTINFFAQNSTPIPNGMIDGNGTVVFAPQGVLASATNDRFLNISSSSLGPFQLAGQGKYTLATSPTGATMAGATMTFTLAAGNYGTDVVAGRCVYVSGVTVGGYNGQWTVLGGGSGTSAFTATAPNGITGLAASGSGTVSISICKGDTSFTLQTAGDSANFSPGQWIVLREHDNGAGDIIMADWMQVLSVASPIINTTLPFRISFGNVRPWATAGGTCSAANPCGLGVIPIVQSALMSGYIIKDFNLLIPKIFNTNSAAGISVTLARGIQITDHTCVDASQNCVFNYLTQGGIIKGNHFFTNIANEQAADVDFVVTANHINEPGSSLFGATQTPGGAAWDLDFGSAFGTWSNNTVGPSLNGGVTAFGGTYYTVISNNTFGPVKAAAGGNLINITGGRGNVVSGNIGTLGQGTTTGVYINDPTTWTVNQSSDSNQAIGNFITGFPGGNYSCSGAWNTDVCSDITTQAIQGFQIGGSVPLSSNARLQMLTNSNNNNLIAYLDTGPTSSRHTILFGPAFGVNIHSLRDRTTNLSFWDCYESTRSCQFGPSISPITTGDLGTTALPWANIWLGTAATNNFKFQPAATAAARVVSIADPTVATSLPLFGGIGAGHLQTKRVAGCATAASLNATCDTTVTWTTAFTDANYTAVCTGDVVTSGIPAIQGIDISAAKTGAAITVRTISITAAAAQFTTLDCKAEHD